MITMGFDDRLESLNDALHHIKELADDLKRLGSRYVNTVDVLDDIKREIEIDEALVEQRLHEQHERELRAMTREYFQMT